MSVYGDLVLGRVHSILQLLLTCDDVKAFADMSEMTSLCYGYGRRVFQAETVVRVILSKTSINSSEVEARSTRLHIRRVVLYSVNAYV